MRHNPLLAVLIFSAVLVIIDIYFYYGLKKLIRRLNDKFIRAIKIIHWLVPVVVITGLSIIVFFRNSVEASNQIRVFHFFSGFFLLFYIPKLVFIVFKLFEDFMHIISKFTASKIVKKGTVNDNLNKISRTEFLSKAGIIAAGIPFISIIYGIGVGRFDFTIRKVPLRLGNLPASFAGFKIVQLSDFHIGSFINHVNEVEKAIDLINSLRPDLLLFTGDMVNNLASELDTFKNIISKLDAKYGKYSILGNHDYGDYVRWDSERGKKENLTRLVDLQTQMGFRMLLNESEKISLGDEHISLIGVENWGLPPFPQYGNMAEAMSNVADNSFKILLSHDPTHWNAQVTEKTNIDLTLSGHTHGAQFGIEIPGWRWSPVSIRYKQWGGLYEENNQYLYVNTGIGFIGFPGRIGMPPEITLFELSPQAS
jgi:hypothetical protein